MAVSHSPFISVQFCSFVLPRILSFYTPDPVFLYPGSCLFIPRILSFYTPDPVFLYPGSCLFIPRILSFYTPDPVFYTPDPVFLYPGSCFFISNSLRWMRSWMNVTRRSGARLAAWYQMTSLPRYYDVTTPLL